MKFTFDEDCLFTLLFMVAVILMLYYFLYVPYCTNERFYVDAGIWDDIKKKASNTYAGARKAVKNSVDHGILHDVGEGAKKVAAEAKHVWDDHKDDLGDIVKTRGADFAKSVMAAKMSGKSTSNALKNAGRNAAKGAAENSKALAKEIIREESGKISPAAADAINKIQKVSGSIGDGKLSETLLQELSEVDNPLIAQLAQRPEVLRALATAEDKAMQTNKMQALLAKKGQANALLSKAANATSSPEALEGLLSQQSNKAHNAALEAAIAKLSTNAPAPSNAD